MCGNNPGKNTLATVTNIHFSFLALWVSYGAAGSLPGLAVLGQPNELGLLLLSYPKAQTQGAAPLPTQECVFLSGEAGTQEGKAERLCLKLAQGDFCPCLTGQSPFLGKSQNQW